MFAQIFEITYQSLYITNYIYALGYIEINKGSAIVDITQSRAKFGELNTTLFTINSILSKVHVSK
jgi:hypothetical protein